MAEQEKALTNSLAELPPTLRETNGTLDRVPAAGNETNPLLKDLQPATAKLPSVARNLSPVLKDLRPTVARLRPALAASNKLLGSTPGLMDTAHGVLPPAQRALHQLGPAINFLRPYTPEAAGWLTNWNTQFATYDSQGHMWSGLLAPGPSALNDNVVLPPPLSKPEAPQPGATVGQPWTDANGSAPR
jgi:phospholipid/cholesterol/gamma-HCH transport system substrate-binding protein